MGEENLYQKLGVAPSATADEIHHAYAALSEKLLSDPAAMTSGTTEVTEDEKLFRELTRAYRTLIDEESRRHYDQSLQQDTEPSVQLVVHKEEVPEHHAVARYQEVILAQHGPTEEWQKEREYFEEHFDEILKPAPKVNLIEAATLEAGVAPVVSTATATAVAHPTEQEIQGEITVRFGTMPTDRELATLDEVKHPRRPISLRAGIDAFDMLLFLGVPLLAVVLLVEYYLFMQ
jgi:hypothetical protein